MGLWFIRVPGTWEYNREWGYEILFIEAFENSKMKHYSIFYRENKGFELSTDLSKGLVFIK